MGHVATHHFKCALEQQMRDLQRAIPAQGPELDRLMPILDKFVEKANALTGARRTTQDRVQLKVADIDRVAYKHFPLCMQQLHRKMRENHHLKYDGRVQYRMFLKGTGISLRDDLQFAIMKAEQLTVLDSKAPGGSKKNPMDIKSLVDVFTVFGFSAEDIIDSHDQCTIFKKIRTELDELLRELATSTKKYDKAILLRDRLRLIKREFVEMQGTYETRRQGQEKLQFNRGIVLAKHRSDTLCAARTNDCEREILHKQEELRNTHEVERAQLETYLHKLKEPHVKFSSLLLELKNTEKNLARLKLFEDAKNVFVRMDGMEREQRALNTAKFESFKGKKRALLLEKQQQELAEAREKLMEKRYVVMRANDSHRKTETQRMKNLATDMKHAHTMDMHSKKVFSTNPVAVVRASHGTTASTYRGQQLLSTVQGKRLEVTSLCVLHDNENGVVPPGSVIYTG
ncbi:hypothetical protein PHYBOEH_004089 [Phytophthora boehmeriae]|uniref:DNA primase large subunit C-terminal domain-containing protein n=1 Tax=Phytophthora boehmeriae TaxID=109152 RepID=A0A8T1X472_9STRA|nr:hypothetical protein PHYBOEH_004089 [Phytophthora boehmeriae]